MLELTEYLTRQVLFLENPPEHEIEETVIAPSLGEITSETGKSRLFKSLFLKVIAADWICGSVNEKIVLAESGLIFKIAGLDIVGLWTTECLINELL